MYQSSYFANINSAATQDTCIKSNCHRNTAMSSYDCWAACHCQQQRKA